MRKVDYYTDAVATVTVHFPEDMVTCQWCPFCRSEDSLRRWKCFLTGEILVFPFDALGERCPLEVKT